MRIKALRLNQHRGVILMLEFEVLHSGAISQIEEITQWFSECNYGQIRAFLSEKQNIAIVAKLDGKIIGLMYGYSLTCFDCETPQFFMYSVDIREEYQNKGYGSQFVNHVIDWVRDSGFCESFVLTNKDNPRACKVYENAGMKHSESDCERMYEIKYRDEA